MMLSGVRTIVNSMLLLMLTIEYMLVCDLPVHIHTGKLVSDYDSVPTMRVC